MRPARPFRSRRPFAALALAALLDGCGGSSSTAPGPGVPAISVQPQAVTVAAGSPFTLSVSATGPGALAYQWYRGATALPGATSATYGVTSAGASDAGVYYVVVTSPAGSAVSHAVEVAVTAAMAPRVLTREGGRCP